MSQPEEKPVLVEEHTYVTDETLPYVRNVPETKEVKKADEPIKYVWRNGARVRVK